MAILKLTMLLPFQKSTGIIINWDNFVCAYSDNFKDQDNPPVPCTCIKTVDGNYTYVKETFAELEREIETLLEAEAQ